MATKASPRYASAVATRWPWQSRDKYSVLGEAAFLPFVVVLPNPAHPPGKPAGEDPKKSMMLLLPDCSSSRSREKFRAEIKMMTDFLQAVDKAVTVELCFFFKLE